MACEVGAAWWLADERRERVFLGRSEPDLLRGWMVSGAVVSGAVVSGVNVCSACLDEGDLVRR